MALTGKAKLAVVERSDEWRPVPGIPWLEATRPDRIRRVFQIEYIRFQSLANGYLRLKVGGDTHTIHKLIAATFLGPRPEGLFINHIDGNKKNNAVDNLEYVTPGENVRHAIRLGLRVPGFPTANRARGAKHPCTKLTQAQVDEIRRRSEVGETRANLGRQFGVGASVISRIALNRSWKRPAEPEIWLW